MGKLKGKHGETKDKFSNGDSWKNRSKAVDEKLESLFDIQWHFYVAIGLFLSVYLKCTSASIPSGDAGDFIMAAHHFGVAHPPGYPLYVTVGYLWMKILPFGSPAFKLNLLTSFIGGLAACVVYITTYKITDFTPSAVFASGVFGFSHLIWFHSIGAEIFSLNNLFCGMLLYWVVRFQRAAVTNRARVAMEASFLAGLSMCNQHTSVLFIGVTGGWMFLSLLRDKAITFDQFVRTGAVFALGLLPYLQLPISAYFAGAPNTWGDHRSLSGIWKHFVREEYGTFRLSSEEDQLSDFNRNLRMYARDLVSELGVSTAVLCAVCVVSARKFPRISTIVYVYAANTMVYLLFFCKQANMDHDSKELYIKGVLERFWMQANIPVSVLAGCGMWCVYSLITERWSGCSKMLYFLLTLTAFWFGALQIKSNYKLCDMSNNYLMRDFGKKLLDEVPRDGVLLLRGDIPYFTASYMRYSENHRVDVDVVDQELIRADWYKTVIGPRFNHYIFPYDRDVYFMSDAILDGREDLFTYNFMDIFDVHREAGVPLYVYPLEMNLKLGDEGWMEMYELVPTNNMIFEVRSKENEYSIDEFLDIAFRNDNDISLQNCDNSLYPVRSWEYDIATKFGSSHFVSAEHAHFKFSMNETAHLDPQNRPLMIRIFNLYKKAYDTLTVMLKDGKKKPMFGAEHHEKYGTVSFQLYKNYLGTNDRVEAGKYARIMTEQLEMYLRRNTDNNAGSNDNSNIRTVLAEARKQFPDLKTNPEYEYEMK